MNLPFLIARRYFLSKKKRNFINVISIISMLAVGFGTMALVVALSVFNGLEDMLRSLHESFDPDLKVKPVRGKTFILNEEATATISALEGVQVVSEVLEDNVYAKYQDAQIYVKLKGVEANYEQHENIVNNIVEGTFLLRKNDINYAILGRGVQYALSLNLKDDFNAIQFYYPNKNVTTLTADPSRLTNQKSILAKGIFAIIKEYDEQYVIVPIDFARELMQEEEKISALEIKVSGNMVQRVKSQIEQILGKEYEVLDKDGQHASILRALKIEKLFVFLTFSFIISIAAFNIFFALTMLGIEKKKDIAVLYTLGAKERTVTNIFLLEGAVIALS